MNQSRSLRCASGFAGLTVGLAAAVLTSLPGCSCTAVGCQSGASVSLDVADDTAVPDGSTVTACFNDMCATGTISAPPVTPGSGVGIMFPQGAGVGGVIWAAGTTGHGRVEIQWFFADDARLQAGDRYRATLMDPAGTIIAMSDAAAASYDTVQPNGPSCAPTCRRARFP